MKVVQIERRRIRIGDSDTKRLDGLVPVTRPIKEGSEYGQASCRPRVPANTGEWERADSDSEEEEAVQMGREGLRIAKRYGARPWEGPRGPVAIATAASTTSKPRGRGSGRDDGTRLWSDDGAIATLEFSQTSLGRRGTGIWQPGSGGPNPAAGEWAGEAAPGPLGHQNPHLGLGGQSGAASAGRGIARVLSGAAAGLPTPPEEKPEDGTAPGTLPTRGETRPTAGTFPEGAAGPMSRYQAGGLRQDRGPKSGRGKSHSSSNHQGSPATPPLPPPGQPARGQ